MDKKSRNIELETWLIETTGEEMMANHLGPNWNRFNEEFGFYPNMSMTIANLVWQNQQAKVEGLQKQVADLDNRATQYALDEMATAKLNGELQKQADAFKDHAVMLRKAAKSYTYTEREQNILLSQADDIEKILGLEQALKGGGQ